MFVASNTVKTLGSQSLKSLVRKTRIANNPGRSRPECGQSRRKRSDHRWPFVTEHRADLGIDGSGAEDGSGTSGVRVRHLEIF